MHKSLTFIVMVALLPMAFVFANVSYTEFTYNYSYETGKISGQAVTKEGNGYNSRTVIVEGVADDKLVYANCEYIVANTHPRDLITVKFKRSNPRVAPDCTLDVLDKTDNIRVNTDMDDLKARAYCMAALGPKYVPHLKYIINKDGKPELESATCIPNTRKVGPTEDKQLVCAKGIKEIDLPVTGNCTACIERFGAINLSAMSPTGQLARQPQMPGIQCAPLTISPGQYTPTYNPDNYVVTSNSQNRYTGDIRDVPTTIVPKNRPPTGPQNEQSQKRQRSLWDSIKQSLMGGGAGGGRPSREQDPRKVMPECSAFLSLDTEIERGESTTLQWSLEYTSAAFITPGIGLVNPTEGSIKISPKETSTYTIQIRNRNGYGKCAPVRVVVTEPIEDNANNDVPQDPILSCMPDKVRVGGTGSVSWRCTSTAVSSTGGSTEYPNFTTDNSVSGVTEVANMRESGKFVVRCLSDTGEEIGRNSCVIDVSSYSTEGDGIYITANKTVVGSGDIVTIAWRAIDVDGCKLTGPDNFERFANEGSITARMYQTSTFTLSCVANDVVLPEKNLTINVN